MQVLNPFEIIAFLEERWLLLIVAVCVWVVLIIVHRLAKRDLKRRAIESGLSPNAVNGLILAIRGGLLYIGITTLFLPFPEILLNLGGVWTGISLLFGTSIGLAVGQSASNFVSGIYIISTHPFGVGDYVRIGDKEGVVREISLNYTRLLQQDGTNALIPNARALTSDLVNFAYDKSKLQVEEEEVDHKDTDRWAVLRRIKKVIETEKVVRYVFTMGFHTNQDLTKLNRIFQEVTDLWTKNFGFHPLYEITEVSNLSFTYLFTIFSDDARKILKHKSQFMDDIIRRVYQP